MPRLLLLLGQSPFDATSGAAQSTRLVAQLAAMAGFSVRVLATTACEGPLDPTALHRPIAARGDRVEDAEGWLRFDLGGIHYRLLQVDPAWKHRWEHRLGERYEAELAADLGGPARPDHVLTYGGDPTDARRRARLRAAGARIIFALHNHAYRDQPPSEVDVFLAPTAYLKQYYTGRLKAPIAVLPPPLDPARCLAPEGPKELITFVNPEPAKGCLLVAELVHRLAATHPAVPILVVGGRVPAEGLLQAGRDVGLDLARHPHLYTLPPTAEVKEIWAETRLLLMPTAIPEAAGRCALEAMLNGGVPLVSDRAGLAEIVGEAGLRLPPPPVPAGRARRVPAGTVERWHETIARLLDEPGEWAERSARARDHAQSFTLAALAPRYARWFASL